MILLTIIAAPFASVAAKPARVTTDASSLIAAVNNLRAANGLPAYSVNDILMGTAQQHADFMSVNGVSHIGYGGTRPYQRALNAGYPLAGDLSQGGLMSENISAGLNESVQDVVLQWQGDAPHLTTMLSPNLQEIGAGVTLVGNYVYYVIDCAAPTGSRRPQYTAVPGQTLIVPGPPLARTVIPNTPDADGKLYHVVKPGETLWLIAITYGVKVAEIRDLNYMTEADAIYPGEKLLIRKNVIVTPPPATPSDTPSARATFTRLPTLRPAQGTTLQPAISSNAQDTARTPLPAPTQIAPYPTPYTLRVLRGDTAGTPTGVPTAPVSSNPSSLAVLGVILLAALALAGVLARAGRPMR